MLDAIPAEAKACPQWIAWQYVWNAERGKFDKIPLSVKTGRKCDVKLPDSWTTFEHACAVVGTLDQQYFGVGFVLGYNSGIVGIDFDNVFDQHGAIVKHDLHTMAGLFNSYTEYSPSNTGLHVMVRAHFPEGRRDKSGVEMYGAGRFFTMTGRVYSGRTTLNTRQTEVAQLASEIDARRSTTSVALDWTKQPTNDTATVHSRAIEANNGEKYQALFNGHWQQLYSSQSEADSALMNIIAYFTDAPSQAVELFKASALGQREKAQRTDYVARLVQLAWDRKPPLVAIPELPMPTETVAAPAVPPADTGDDDEETLAARNTSPFTCPPGLAGYLYQWFGAQSTHPMQEINVIGALGMLAGICGRQYQYSGTGLNLYMMLLALTGAGKESLTDGITRLFSAVISPPVDHSPSAHNIQSAMTGAADFLGNFDLTSGVGIKRSFNDSGTLCCVSIASEFSQTMTQLADPKAHQGLKDARQVMLDFYSKSGAGVTYQGKMNAEKSKDIKVLQSPTLSIVAQGTPERFYEALTDRMVSDGLMSRFMVIEVPGYHPYNVQHAANQRVPADLRQHIAALCGHVIQLKVNGDLRINVDHTAEAEAYSTQLMHYYRKRLEGSTDEMNRALWNRAHQNIIRIASLVAIGCNYYTPVIDVTHLQWANAIVYRQCALMVAKFKRGETGQTDLEETDQYQFLLEVIRRYANTSPDTMMHDPKAAKARHAGVLPYQYLLTRTSRNRAFKHDRRGATFALKLQIEQAMNTGVLKLVQYGESTGKYYSWSL